MKSELVALAILIPLVIIFGFVIARIPEGKAPKADVQQAQLPATPQSTADVAGVQDVEQTVVLVIEYPDEPMQYDVVVNGETTVEQVLNKAVNEHDLRMSSKDFGGELGIFVESFGDITNDEASGLYWHLYVNGELSPLGASSAKVKAKDIVTWKYEEMHEE